MANPSEPVRIQLTPEQQNEIRRATGNAEYIELSAQELEERISPMKAGWKPTL